jgi:DNA replication protein DnaD
MAGWQKIYRDIQEHWLWEDKPFSRGQAWIDLILLVNHEDNKTLIDGELIDVKRGSKITSLRKLAEQWGWSVSKVKKFLEQLEKDKMIVFRSDNKKTLVTIENYGIYQGKENTEITVKEQSNNTEVTQKKFRSNSEKIQKETNKNDKEYIKNDKEGKEGEESKTKLPSFPTPIHELIFNQWKSITYKTFFEDSEIEDKEHLITITVKEMFKKTIIETGYAKAIGTLTGKSVSVKLKEGE